MLIKRIFFANTMIFSILFFIFLPSEAHPQSPQIDNGLVYLNNTQSQTGSWSNTPDSISTEYLSTAEVLLSLEQFGLTNTSVYQNGLLWIQSQEVHDTAYLAKKIQIMANSGVDLTTDIAMLTSYKNLDSGWGGYLSFESSNYRTVIAVQTLKTVKYTDQTVLNNAVNYLLSTQNDDGGFGFYQSDDSSVYMTVLVSSTLQQFPQTTSIVTAINKATSFLIANQNTDGGFGSSDSTVYETAHTYLALIGVTTDATVLGNTINYLSSTQLPNGSWEDDPYSTALALRALANVKPNLSLSSSDIAFSTPTPTIGETITVSVNVKNTGTAQADNVVVQFYDGDPSAGGLLIGETAIASVSSFGSAPASITYTISTASSRTIFIKIDPLNTIDELNEADNIASKNLTSSTLPDLSITASDITMFPPFPDPYMLVAILIKVRNHGETDASNVLIEVYDGNPSSGGVKLSGEGIIRSIPAGDEADIVAVIEPENVRQPWKDIYVLIDPQNNMSETNETNNAASKRFSIGASVDLSVSSDGITFNPTNPREGDTVEISARVNNTGYGQPQNVLVRFYLGDPKAGGTRIGTDVTIPSIGYNSNATVSATWNTTGHIGNNKIYVFADPEDSIEEEYESTARIWGLDVTNNIAFKTLKVSTSQGPDLTLTTSDITFTPQSPLKGDLVTIAATVRNIGNQDANNVPVEFSVYDPVIGTSLIIGSQTIPFIPVGGSATTQIQWETNIFSGSYDIQVNIDPSNIIIEITETNNEAQKPVTITPPQGPDIVIFSIDKSGVSSNPQTRTISGNVNITIKNVGNQNTIVPFVITAFEDRNNNLAFNPGTDSILGQATYSGNLSPEMTTTVNIPVSGTVLFIDSPIYLFVDSGNAVTEIDETNNTECLGIFTLCRRSNVDEAIKEGASWLIAHQLNVDQQGTMKAWAGSQSLYYNALAVQAYMSNGRTLDSKYVNVLNKLVDMQAPDGSWDESVQSTANAILSLLYIGTQNNSQSITDAIAWLIRQQSPDGSWGGYTYSTGLALTALMKAGVNKNEPCIQNAVQWLTVNQNADGYWGDYPGVASNYFIDTYPVIGLALATSRTDSRVQAAKNWYYFRRLYWECTRVFWLRMMLEIEPTHSDIMNVATSLQNLQRPDGGWRWYYVYSYSSFEMTADTLHILGSLGVTGTRIDNGIQWIENHINPLWEAFHEQKLIQTTDWALDALQAARIGDTANLNAITAGRKAIVNSQNSDGSWASGIPVSYAPFIGPTGDSIFALKYYQNITPAEQLSATKGSNFLAGTQLSDGGWPSMHGQGVSDFYSTEGALTSLLQFGLSVNNPTISRALSYYATKEDGGFVKSWRAPIIYKLAGSNYQTKLEQAASWIKSIQGQNGSWGNTTAGTSAYLIALSFANESGMAVARGASWLVAAQNEDGGWGPAIGVPMSSDYNTAYAVWALSLAKFSLAFNLDLALERPRYCPGDIVRITVTPDKPAQEITLEGSVTLQEGNSYPLSFVLEGDIFSTDFIVPESALPGAATVHVYGTATYGYGVGTTSFIVRNCSTLKPDLSISASDIRARSEDLNNIDSRTVYADVRNQGGIDANNVTINFYKGSVSPENLIDSKAIQNIPASGSSTVSTVAVLNEDTVIYVVVDPDNAIDEIDKGNNIASVVLIREIPDLSISQTDITIIPPVIEGQSAVITAIIHNIGNLSASDADISFYDGDPQSGGTLIGSLTKSLIEAGATALAEMTWNTFGQSGRNYIHVAIDPQNLIKESNKNNNSTMVSIDVAPPTKPDLAITSTDITFSSLNPKEGDPLILNAAIHNFGTEASDIEVNLYDGAPSSGGILLSQKTIQQIIPFGGTFALSFSLDTIGLTGNHSFYIALDPNNRIDETNETNNTAWNSLTVGSSGLNLSISTDKTSYAANEDSLITVGIQDMLGSARSGTLTIKVVDLNNNVVLTVTTNQAVTLSPNENKALTFTWNTVQTLAGNYKVYSQFTENGKVISKADIPITVNPLIAISSRVTTDKISYFPLEPVTITSTIQSTSTNYIFENLSAKITIANNQGDILYTETNAVPILMPGQLTEAKTFWNTSVNPPGVYPVTLEVKDSSGTVISTSTANITITDAVKPSKLLKGQISVDKQSLLQGEPVNITYSITNIGNIDLAQIDLSILTVHIVQLTTYDTLTDQTALQIGQTYSNTQQLNTNTYTAKDYLVILRATVSGVTETITGSYFRVEGAPSAPSLSSPQHGEDVETLTPVFTVNNASDPNDDKLTYQFELYSDSGLTNLIASSGIIQEGTDITSWPMPFELTENATCYWRARAYDWILYGAWMSPASFRVNVENDPPTAPTLSSPADNAETDTLTPVLTVNNTSDPDSSNLTYNYEVSLNTEFTQIVASEIGIFEGTGTTSWQIPVSLNENTLYYWRAQADDWLTEGPWMNTARFFVNTANDAPTAPVILYPSNNDEITSLFTDIIITNSTDPDSAHLTYLFEIDTKNTFDSSNIIRSGNLPEGQGTTLWHVEGLSDNTVYYVRGKASDGSAESPWSEVAGFFVNTVNDPPTIPVLANPSEGSGVNTFTPTLSVHNSTDIDRDILTYEFEVYADAAMTNLVTNIIGVEETEQITSWTVPVTLTENMTYYWRARAFDGELHSDWMPKAAFMVNTANDAPTAPQLHAPAEGSSLDTLNPGLSVSNAIDPDSDSLTYDFEVYANGTLIQLKAGIPQDISGITSVTLTNALSDNTTYTWRARAYDGDRYGAWMDMATFSIHLPVTNITATIDFDPNTLNQKSKGTWVTVYIELPSGYNVADIIISSIRLNGTIPAESRPYDIGDCDHDGRQDLMVKFKRSDVINLLPDGDNVRVLVTGTVGTTTFEGVDIIRVIH